jgi:SOS-response transcriptional repressor LexA
VNDVVIGEFAMPWEKKDAFWKWATDDSGMEQVGTVYTAQGFEFDYIAVIFGHDLVYDTDSGAWKAVPERSHDTAVRRNNPKLAEHLANVYRVLLSRAHKGVYVYFMDRNTESYFRSQIEAASAVRHAAERSATTSIVLREQTGRYRVYRREDAAIQAGAFKTHLPVYSLQAAAGYFGGGEQVEEEGWVDASAAGRLAKGMFVAKVIGRSMEPEIRDGDLCVFRANPPGSRQGKVVLVQYRGAADPETGGAFTVKRYRSQKLVHEDGTWEHEQITLEPLNPAFKPIMLTPKEEGDLVLIGELVKVLP